ncbi:MAG: hypothetical protein ACR2QM_02290 [Longimicrobiales bacterium]
MTLNSELARRTCLLAGAILVGILPGDGASAQTNTAVSPAQCASPGVPGDVRPNGPGDATEVSVAVFLVDLTRVDDVDQSVVADLIVFQSWTDSRLEAFEGCEIPLSRVWHPQLDFVNSGPKSLRRTGLADQIGVGPGGAVVHQQRYYGTFATYHNLRDFPFDRHVFQISLLSSEYDEDEVVLLINDEQTGRRDVLNISDWRIGEVEAVPGTYVMETTGRRLSTYEFQIDAQREMGFYIWKVMVPLTLIVAMSWAVFWLSGPQIGLSATAMLTLIAFQFAMVGVLPRLGYFTTLDKFTTGSTVLVFLALVEAVTTSYLEARDRHDDARRLDRNSRWLFPLGFFISTLVALTV